MAAADDNDLHRLRWQCRRGLLELDCVFEDYLEQAYLQSSAELQGVFRDLLNEQDPDLQAWILHGEPAPPHFQTIVRILRKD